MNWFEFSTEEQRTQRKDPDIKKHLITTDEFESIINASKDRYGLWETYYLSGGRLNEVRQMKIKDVKIEGDNVTIVLTNSKTIPREVPLTDIPNRLIRWMENHPHKDDLEYPLWISQNPRWLHQHPQIARPSIQQKFETLKKQTGIKSTLSIKSFRATRATILFSSRDPIYDDKEMGQLFGWKPHTVVDRREQYDLRNFEDLKTKIFDTTIGKLDTYDSIKHEKELLEQKHEKELKKQQKEIDDLKETVETLLTHYKEVTGKGD